MTEVAVVGVDPAAEDVAALISAHFALAQAASPPEDVHALNPETVSASGAAFYGVYSGRRLAAIGALRPLDSDHIEIKAMHTANWARGNGFGRIMLRHLLRTAAGEGFTRVSLETGTMEEFAAARSLYRSEGFQVCLPFGEYVVSPNSVCMTVALDAV